MLQSAVPAQSVTSVTNVSDTEALSLNAEQAAQWRKTHRALSIERTLLIQTMAAIVVVMVVGLITQSLVSLKSAAYGAMAVLLPATVFAFGVIRVVRGHDGVAAVSLMRLAIWEGVKVVFTIGILCLAPVLLGPAVSWFALLIGFLFVLKSYWFALWWQSRK